MALSDKQSEQTTPSESRKKLRLVRLLIGGFVTLLFLAAASAGGMYYYANMRFQAEGPFPSRDAEVTVFEVPAGHGLAKISNQLENSGLIQSSLIFQAGVIWHGCQNKLQAGEFAIPSGSSMLEIMEILREGKVVLHKLTVPEGLTTAQVMELMDSNKILIGEIGEMPPEGSLLPETYFFPRGTTRRDLVEQMIRNRADVLAKLWVARVKDLPFATPEEAVILASIVEEETGIPEERPRVASVFINRLKKKMRLGSDPTVIYGLTGGEPLGRGLRKSELKKKTPYNTYEIDGLPPTAITNPGRDAIAAVLHPANTNDLYFVADGSGGHVFAPSYQEHQRNVAAWRRIERQKKNSQ